MPDDALFDSSHHIKYGSAWHSDAVVDCYLGYAGIGASPLSTCLGPAMPATCPLLGGKARQPGEIQRSGTGPGKRSW